ncbi:MAG: hypothetical protein J6W29_04845 [Neisseriaceae bacterium]|nr:hypothetical protein [Neisseriaceae bacterium]
MQTFSGSLKCFLHCRFPSQGDYYAVHSTARNDSNFFVWRFRLPETQ